MLLVQVYFILHALRFVVFSFSLYQLVTVTLPGLYIELFFLFKLLLCYRKDFSNEGNDVFVFAASI